MQSSLVKAIGFVPMMVHTQGHRRPRMNSKGHETKTIELPEMEIIAFNLFSSLNYTREMCPPPPHLNPVGELLRLAIQNVIKFLQKANKQVQYTKTDSGGKCNIIRCPKQTYLIRKCLHMFFGGKTKKKCSGSKIISQAPNFFLGLEPEWRTLLKVQFRRLYLAEKKTQTRLSIHVLSSTIRQNHLEDTTSDI